jgi:hypothetical protein
MIAGNKTIEVRIEALAIVTGDPGALGRVLTNLIQNAVEHGGRRVIVRVTGSGFEVEDDGPGIPPSAKGCSSRFTACARDDRNRPGAEPRPGSGRATSRTGDHPGCAGWRRHRADQSPASLIQVRSLFAQCRPARGGDPK